MVTWTRVLAPAALLVCLAFSTTSQAAPPSAPAAAAAASHVTRAPNGRFVTVATTVPRSVHDQPKTLLVTGGKPMPAAAMMFAGGTLQRLGGDGTRPGRPVWVTPMRSWRGYGYNVSQPIQFMRRGAVYEYTPTAAMKPYVRR